MYIISDFQEERRRSIAPWLIGGGLLAAGGVGLALASKGKVKADPVLVKKGTDDAKKLITTVKKKASNSERVASRRKLLTEARALPEDLDTRLRVINEKQKGRYILSPLEQQLPSNRKLDQRFETNKNIAESNKKVVSKAQQLAKSKNIEYMKYTVSTAEFGWFK